MYRARAVGMLDEVTFTMKKFVLVIMRKQGQFYSLTHCLPTSLFTG